MQQDILSFINEPTEALTGRPLIGNGDSGTPGTGDDGGAGGWLFGNGGNVQQDILSFINEPTEALTGRPLIGNGDSGTPGTGGGRSGGWP